MTRHLICGCPRHTEPGHARMVFALPIRADAFAHTLRTFACKAVVRPRTKDDNGECGQAIMVMGVDDVR